MKFGQILLHFKFDLTLLHFPARMSGIPPHLTRGRGRGFVILDNEFLSRRGATASAARAAPFVPVSRGSRGNFLQNLIASAETSASAQTSGGATAAISRTRGTTREDMGAHIYTTKPENIESKVGKDGAPVKLITNYFRLLKKPDFEFNLYRVDFNPDVDIEGLRKSFLFKQKEILGGYLFDGKENVVGVNVKPSLFFHFRAEHGLPNAPVGRRYNEFRVRRPRK